MDIKKRIHNFHRCIADECVSCDSQVAIFKEWALEMVKEELTVDVNKMEWVDDTKKWDMGVEPCIECQNADKIKNLLERLN